jgi:hypothetical protein
MSGDRWSRWSTEGMPTGVEAMRVQLEIARTMADVIKDNRRSVHDTSSISDTASAPQQRGNGWQPDRPLAPPPGISIIDQMVDAALGPAFRPRKPDDEPGPKAA